MASVSLQHIYKVYAGGVTAVSDFNLDIKDKEFIVLVGPSGCGKSTTLRMVAGLEEISEGELYIGDRLVNDVAPKDRDIAMVFQNFLPVLVVAQLLFCFGFLAAEIGEIGFRLGQWHHAPFQKLVVFDIFIGSWYTTHNQCE